MIGVEHRRDRMQRKSCCVTVRTPDDAALLKRQRHRTRSKLAGNHYQVDVDTSSGPHVVKQLKVHAAWALDGHGGRQSGE